LKTGIILWDKKVNAIIEYKKLGLVRVIFGIIVFLGSLLVSLGLYSLGIYLSEEEDKLFQTEHTTVNPGSSDDAFGFYFENKCYHPLMLVLRYKGVDGSWHTEAVWDIDAGFSGYLRDEYGNKLKTGNAVWYYYAKTTDDSNLEWIGDHYFLYEGVNLPMIELEDTDGDSEWSVTCQQLDTYDPNADQVQPLATQTQSIAERFADTPQQTNQGYTDADIYNLSKTPEFKREVINQLGRIEAERQFELLAVGAHTGQVPTGTLRLFKIIADRAASRESSNQNKPHPVLQPVRDLLLDDQPLTVNQINRSASQILSLTSNLDDHTNTKDMEEAMHLGATLIGNALSQMTNHRSFVDQFTFALSPISDYASVANWLNTNKVTFDDENNTITIPNAQNSTQSESFNLGGQYLQLYTLAKLLYNRQKRIHSQ